MCLVKGTDARKRLRNVRTAMSEAMRLARLISKLRNRVNALYEGKSVGSGRCYVTCYFVLFEVACETGGFYKV